VPAINTEDPLNGYSSAAADTKKGPPAGGPFFVAGFTPFLNVYAGF